jgi:hypothetical protein
LRDEPKNANNPKTDDTAQCDRREMIGARIVDGWLIGFEEKGEARVLALYPLLNILAKKQAHATFPYKLN